MTQRARRRAGRGEGVRVPGVRGDRPRRPRARLRPVRVNRERETTGKAMRGAGGSRTRFRGFADRRPAVRLRRLVASTLPRRAMSSPGIEPGLRPSQSRVRVRHTPRTFVDTDRLPSPPPGNRTRSCGFEGRRASATPAGKVTSALARSRTWSSTFGGSRAVRHTPRAQSKPTAGLEPA